MPSVEITLDGSTVAAVLAACAAITAAILFYRFTLPAVPLPTRLLLSLLRGVALGLMVFLVFAPALRLISSGEQRPLLALLVDGTGSMQLSDGGPPRFRIVDSLLQGPAIETLSAASRLQTFAVGTGLRPVPAPDSILYTAPVTDLAGAIEALAQRHRRTPFSAVLLLSDGAYNRGDHPVHAAGRLGVPIVTVGIGDTTEGRDVLVARVAANSIVYEGTESPVDITIRSSGAGGERVDVRLLADGRTLASSALTLAPGTREYTVRLAYVPEGSGMRKYTASVSGLRDELTAENNRRTFFARVLKSRLRVVILGGAPSPDLTAVRFTLSGVDRFAVRAYAQRPVGGWHEQAPSASTIDSADCVVLVGFPTASTSQGFLRLLSGSLTAQRTPVLFLGGRDVDHARLLSLGETIPFTAAMPSQTEQLIAVEPSAAEHTNQLLTLSRPEGSDAWKRLPPVYATVTVFTPRPGATTLAEVKTQGGISGGPLILTRSIGGQKSMAVLAHGIWRWRLMAQGRPETATLLVDFLTASVEWLTTRDDTRPFRVLPARALFAQGEPVEFTAELYDANNRPVDRADVSVMVRSGDTRVGVALRPLGNGRYDGSVDGLPEGDYAFEGRATDGQAELGVDAGRFAVGGVNIEFQDTRMNRAVLQEVATVTGGAFFTVARFDSAIAAVRGLPSFVPTPVQDDRRFELWTLPSLLGAIIILLSVEWYIRKRRGML
jgi:hypothetical protein